MWAVACALAVVVVVAVEGPRTWAVLQGLEPWAALLGTGAAVAGVGVSAGLWRAALDQLGGRISPADTVRAFFPSQAGKYLPGGLWPVLAHVGQADRFGLTPALGGAAFAWFLVLHLVTGGAVATAGLAVARAVPAAVGLVAVPAALLTLPPVARAAARAVGRATRGRVDLAVPPRGRGAARAVAPLLWATAMWGLYGVSVAAFLSGLGAAAAPLLAAGAFAAAWCAGFLAIVAPAGAGAREAVLVALLAPVTGVPTALAVTVLARAAHLVGDVGWAIAGLVLGPRGPGPGRSA